MTNNSQYFLARADESAREAGNSGLTNVRERHLRSAEAWRGMAARLLHSENLREAIAAGKNLTI